MFWPLTVAFRCVGPSPEVFGTGLREIPSVRGEGPSYMKVPYTYPPFQVTSSHHCTVCGVGRVFRIKRGCENAFVCICTSVCMCVFSRSLKTLYGAPEGEGLNGKLSILVFKDFGLGAKFLQKMKSVCCVKVVENGAESLGVYKNTF